MRIAAVFFAVLSWPLPALAHDGPHAPAGAGVSGWDAAVLCLLAAAAVLYAAGSRRQAVRGANVRRMEPVAFWAGWTALVAAASPPFDQAAARTFSAHMLQHELLMLVGTPLAIAGRPIVRWLWAMPDSVRRHASGVLQDGGVSRTWHLLTAPAVASGLHGVALWIWHAPGLYESAVANESVHALQHAILVATAVLFWWGLVYGRYGRAAYGASALYVFATMVHTGVLGAIFALAESPFYAIYRDRAAAEGVDAVADQQLAGLYMWIPAGVVLTLFGLALFLAWLSEADRRSKASYSN